MSSQSRPNGNGVSEGDGDGHGDGANPLYLQELLLQDCTCQPVPLLPQWRRWSHKSHAGKRKVQPSPRGGHTAVWIPNRRPTSALASASASASSSVSSGFGSIILFAGSNRQAKTFNELWKFDLLTNEWISLSVTGPSPPIRSGHSSIYDSTRDRIIIFGGQHIDVIPSTGEMSMKFYRDVWSLDIGSGKWTKLPDQGDAPQRNGHTAVICNRTQPSTSPSSASNDLMVIFGGSDSDGPSSAVWLYDLTTYEWTLCDTRGPQPEARELHAACNVELEDGKQYMIITSGRGVEAILNTCYALSLPSSTTTNDDAWCWKLVGQSPPRCAHTMAVLQSAKPQQSILPIFTQSVPATLSTTDASSSVSAAASPSPSTLSLPLSIFVYGGTDGVMFYNDVLLYSVDPSRFTSSTDPPRPCSKCQGPEGWITLQRPDSSNEKSGDADGEIEGAADQISNMKVNDSNAAVASSSSSSTSSKSSKKRRKKKDLTDVQPPTSFAHTLTTIPLPSPMFHQPTLSSSSSSSSSSPSSSSSSFSSHVPGTFFLFGGMNDETDLDTAHFLSFKPFTPV